MADICPVKINTPATSKQCAHRLLYLPQPLLEARAPAHEGAGKARRQQKRQADAERINQQQTRALARALLGAGDQQDGGEHRPHAWRPAEAEGKPDHIGADQAGRTVADPDAGGPVQHRNLDQAEEMQPHHADQHAGDIAQPAEIGADRLADPGGGGAERHKNGAETGHETQRRHQHQPAGAHPALFQHVLDRNPAHIGKVRGHQRQHTGREKRQKPGQEGTPHRHVQVHDLTLPPSTYSCLVIY